VRDGPLGTLIIRPQRGLPIVVWPFIEDFYVLADALKKSIHRSNPMTS